MSLKRKTVNNAVWNAVSFILPLILFLITTPYYAEKLGPTPFGILFLVLAVIGYFSIFDFGFSSATLKYLSEYIGKEDSKKIKEIISGSFTIYLALGIFGSLAILLSVDFIVDKIFRVEERNIEAAKFAFYVASFAFTFKMLSTVFNAIIRAFQRYDLATKIGLVFSAANLMGGVFLLYLGFRLKAIIIWYFLLIILQLPVFIVACRKLFPEFKIHLGIKKGILKMLFNFSWPAFISGVSGMLAIQFDKVLIGAMISVAAVTFYTIPAELSIRIHSFIANFSQIIFPLSSELKAKEDNSRLEYLYFKSNKIIIMIATSVIVPLYVFSDKIISFWMGSDFANKTSFVFPVLLISYYIVIFTIVPYFFLNGLNKPKVNALYSFLSFILNLISCLILIPKYGINGAAIATFIGMLQVPFYIWTFHKISGFSIAQLLNKIFVKIWVVGLIQFIIIKFLFYNLVDGKTSLLVVLSASFAIFYILFILFRFYDDDDKNLVLSYFPHFLLPKNRRII
jgi:O-antigen/teichoic acid export membrane protein